MNLVEGYGLVTDRYVRRVAGYTYTLQKLDDLVIVFRSSIKGDVRKIPIAHSTSMHILVVPEPPLLVPDRVADHIMLRMSTPLILPPKTKIKLYSLLRVDVALVVEHNGGVLVVDEAPLGRPRYALYGTPDRGLITSYQIIRLLKEKPRAKWLPLIELSFENETTTTVKVSRIVFPGYMLRIFYNGPYAVAAPLQISVTSKDEAQVTIMPGWSPPKEFKEAPRLFTQPTALQLISRFVMEYGL